jgi:hypothetical protein
MVKAKFGQATHDHIVDMTKISLQRKYAISPKVQPGVTRLVTDAVPSKEAGAQ